MLHEWSFVWWDCSVFDRQTEWQTDTLESHRFPCVLTTLVWDIWQCLFFLDCLSLIVQNAKPNCFIHFTLSHSISIHFEKQKERPESGLIRCKSIGISVCPFVGFCCCFSFGFSWNSDCLSVSGSGCNQLVLLVLTVWPGLDQVMVMTMVLQHWPKIVLGRLVCLFLS